MSYFHEPHSFSSNTRREAGRSGWVIEYGLKARICGTAHYLTFKGCASS